MKACIINIMFLIVYCSFVGFGMFYRRIILMLIVLLPLERITGYVFSDCKDANEWQNVCMDIKPVFAIEKLICNNKN